MTKTRQSPKPRKTAAETQVTRLLYEIAEQRKEIGVQTSRRIKEQAKGVADRARAGAREKGLLARLVTIQEEERRRLSREMHDQLGQPLTALRLMLTLLKETDARAALRRHIENAETIAERLDRVVDHLAWKLRPAALDEFGLVAALEALVPQWSEYHQIEADMQRPSGRPSFNPDVESQLYRIVQEALNNVAKHAGASHARVVLERSSRHWLFSVHDNGRGFDTSKAGSGLGLLGIRERAALIGARVTIDSNSTAGTTVTVRVPIARRPKTDHTTLFIGSRA